MDTMTENDYLIAWGLYAFAALGCLLVWFRLTRWTWRWLREPLRLLVAVLLFSPTIIDPVKEKFAPAVAITALDMLFMYAIIVFALYLLFVLIRWPLERAGKARRLQAEQARSEAARQAEEDEPFASDHRYGRPEPLSANRPRVEPRL